MAAVIPPRLAFLMPLLLVVAAGCSGGDAPVTPTNIPVPTVTEPMRSTPTPLPHTSGPCPARNDVCVLAHAYLSAIRTADAARIVEASRAQHLTCPSGRETTTELWMIRPCEGRTPGSIVEVYELHTGKGPVFFRNRDEYLASVSQGLAPVSSGAVTVAIGCAVRGSTAAAAGDCSVESVAVYRVPGISAEIALVFSRPSEIAEWAIEKLWYPFPSSVPETIPMGFRLGINTLSGVDAFELYPYSPE